MGQHDVSVGFGDYLRDAIHAAGFATPTQFARAVRTDPSVVLRWLSEEQRPTIRSLERVAPALGKTINEMVNAAYHDRLIEKSSAHPVVIELTQLTGEDSPLSVRERESLISQVNQVIDRFRRPMKTA
jgi:transcriptional regulator with XRE-family HTH domain